MTTAAAIFFFVVKPIDAIQRAQLPAADGPSDEERRHQELLAALEGLKR